MGFKKNTDAWAKLSPNKKIQLIEKYKKYVGDKEYNGIKLKYPDSYPCDYENGRSNIFRDPYVQLYGFDTVLNHEILEVLKGDSRDIVFLFIINARNNFEKDSTMYKMLNAAVQEYKSVEQQLLNGIKENIKLNKLSKEL